MSPAATIRPRRLRRPSRAPESGRRRRRRRSRGSPRRGPRTRPRGSRRAGEVRCVARLAQMSAGPAPARSARRRARRRRRAPARRRARARPSPGPTPRTGSSAPAVTPHGTMTSRTRSFTCREQLRHRCPGPLQRPRRLCVDAPRAGPAGVVVLVVGPVQQLRIGDRGSDGVQVGVAVPGHQDRRHCAQNRCPWPSSTSCAAPTARCTAAGRSTCRSASRPTPRRGQPLHGARRPLALAAAWEVPTQTDARKLEARVKQLTRREKVALTGGAPLDGATPVRFARTNEP